MVTRIAVRPKNKVYFIKCIQLRKQGLSYSEIRKQVPIAKSTINNWLQLAGLTLTAEHLNIKKIKTIENHMVGTEAAKVTRANKKAMEISQRIEGFKGYFSQSLFISGAMLYEAEGSKTGSAKFSNSDFRIINMFIKFVETYFGLKKISGMHFRVAIHETRHDDLVRIISFWSKRIKVPYDAIKITWKKNKIIRRKENMDYVGQMTVSLHGEIYLVEKLLSISGIILSSQLRE